jgi:hypothetical protein
VFLVDGGGIRHRGGGRGGTRGQLRVAAECGVTQSMAEPPDGDENLGRLVAVSRCPVADTAVSPPAYDTIVR